MIKKISDKNLDSLILEIEDSLHSSPIHNLEVGKYYQYVSSGDLFSKSFTFKVVEDNMSHYVIIIEGEHIIPLEKTYNLVDSINQRHIYQIDISAIK